MSYTEFLTRKSQVGSEGGFAPREIDALLDAGWQATRLAPYVLRVDTAVAVGLAFLGWEEGSEPAA